MTKVDIFSKLSCTDEEYKENMKPCDEQDGETVLDQILDGKTLDDLLNPNFFDISDFKKSFNK